MTECVVRPLDGTGGELCSGGEEARCGPRVAAGAGTVSGGGEPPGGSAAECADLRVDRAELGAVVVAQREVVPDDLLVLGHPLAGDPLEPDRELLVQGGTELLCARLVGRVADKDVLEAKGVFAHKARPGGSDDVLGSESLQALRHVDARGRFGERDDGAAVKDLSLDCPALECVAIRSIEPVEPCAEEGVKARWERARVQVADQGADVVVVHAQHALFEEHRHQLLDKQWISLRGRRDPQPHGSRRRTKKALQQHVDAVLVERFESDADRPVGPLLEQLGPR